VGLMQCDPDHTGTSSKPLQLCEEALWHEFLQRISLIESIQIERISATAKHVKLIMIPLGQFRKFSIFQDGVERFEIRYEFEGKAMPELDDLAFFETALSGSWTATVIYISPQIVYFENFNVDTVLFSTS
jgi:hypothetical protein